MTEEKSSGNSEKINSETPRQKSRKKHIKFLAHLDDVLLEFENH